MVLPVRRKAPLDATNTNGEATDDAPLFVPPKTPFKKPRLSDATAETTWTHESDTPSSHRTGSKASLGQDFTYENSLVNEHGSSSPTANTIGPTASANNDDAPNDEAVEADEEQQAQGEPLLDWDKLAEHESARKDIQVFLDAQARKEAADERFAAAMDECHATLHTSITALLQAAADLYNHQRDHMEAAEAEIQHHLVSNDELRGKMQTRLQESATVAQGLFAQLLMRVTAPLQAMCVSDASGASVAQPNE